MEATLIIEGMTCGGCEKSVRNAIMQTQGVADVAIDRSKNQARVRFKSVVNDSTLQAAAVNDIIENVDAAGFECRLHS
jgi:copper chaperone CopZ